VSGSAEPHLSPFGQWLEAHADDADLSLGQAAARAGLSERTLELSLSGRQLRAETCRRLAGALGLDASQVLRAAGHPVAGDPRSDLPAELEEIVEKIQAAEPSTQATLLRAWRSPARDDGRAGARRRRRTA
jgi:hypothetical protein